MFLNSNRKCVIPVLLLTSLLLPIGCSGPASTPAKTDLTEQEQQQVKELDTQREQEWGTTKK